MSAINFTLNFGSGNSGLTLNARLLDVAGGTVGSLITSGFVDLGDGIYSYQHTGIPNNHRGTFKAWAPADPSLGSVGIAVNPEDAEDISDILFYVRNLINAQAAAAVVANSNSGGANEPGDYVIEPADFRMVTSAELLASLKTLIQEPALKSVHAEAAIKSAIEEDDHRPMVALTYYQAITKEECDYPAPCGGERVVSVEVLPDCYTCSTGDDCYIPVWFRQDKNRIHLNMAMDGTAKITTVFGNRLIGNSLTVALAVETSTEGLWQIYIEGQPELPGSGVIRICGDPWVYAYKSGTTFASATIDSTDSFDSAGGLPPPEETEEEFEVVVLGETGTTTVAEPSYGAPAPTGKHTCLYARRVANCGRLADSELVTKMAGATVEWPLIFASGAYREYIMALATSKAYAYLINSSRSDRDVQRFAQLQTHWENQAARLHSKVPKFKPGAARRQFINGSFTANPLRVGRLTAYDGGLSGVRIFG